MREKMIFMLLFFAALARPGLAASVSEADFKCSTTRNLVNLCSAPADDPHAKEAIHFCHGYLVGAYSYYVASTSGPDGRKLFCLPDPEPSRNEAISMFLKWAKARPQLLDQLPVETEFMFLIDTWPCKKQP